MQSTKNYVAKQIQDAGFKCKPAKTTADLGIDRGSRSAIRARKSKGSTRRKKAAARFSKVIKIAAFSKCRRASRLAATTGAIPQASYDAKIYGAPPSTTQRWRRCLGQSVAGKRWGRCLTTTLALHVGSLDPSTTVPIALAGTWLQLVIRNVYTQNEVSMAPC